HTDGHRLARQNREGLGQYISIVWPRPNHHTKLSGRSKVRTVPIVGLLEGRIIGKRMKRPSRELRVIFTPPFRVLMRNGPDIPISSHFNRIVRSRLLVRDRLQSTRYKFELRTIIITDQSRQLTVLDPVLRIEEIIWRLVSEHKYKPVDLPIVA